MRSSPSPEKNSMPMYAEAPFSPTYYCKHIFRINSNTLKDTPLIGYKVSIDNLEAALYSMLARGCVIRYSLVPNIRPDGIKDPKDIFPAI